MTSFLYYSLAFCFTHDTDVLSLQFYVSYDSYATQNEEQWNYSALRFMCNTIESTVRALCNIRISICIKLYYYT
jgi:hypothetical protein